MLPGWHIRTLRLINLHCWPQFPENTPSLFHWESRISPPSWQVMQNGRSGKLLRSLTSTSNGLQSKHETERKYLPNENERELEQKY